VAPVPLSAASLNNGTTIGLATYSKLAGTAGADPGPYVFTFSGSVRAAGGINAYDPATNGVRILLDDAGANGFSGDRWVDVTVPGGPGWKTSKSGYAWRYKNLNAPGGIVRIQLSHLTRKPGTLKFRVLGRAGSLAIPRTRVPMKATLVVDPPIALTGQCGETAYDGSRCKFSRSGRALRCR
jgi:hypothetical protein